MLIERDLPPAELAPAPEPESETLDLVRYWRAVNRHKWRILALVAVVSALATLYAFTLRPVYRATVTVMVETTKQRALSNEELYAAVMGAGTRDYFLTQFEILKSREFAERLVKVMALGKHPEYDPRQRSRPWYLSWLPSAGSGSAPGADPVPPEVEDGIVASVMGGVKVQPVRNTQLVKVSFDSHDPELAARVPNTLATIYIVSDLESRMEQSRRAITFLTEHTDDLKKKVNDAERALQEYRERAKIVDAKNVSLAGAGRQLDELTSSLVDARRRRSDAETMLNQVSAARQNRASGALETLPAVQKHPLILKFREAEAEAERRLQEAAKRYGAEHPRMIAAQSDLKAAQENLRRQVEFVVQTLSRDVEVARQNEASIERAVARAKDDIQGINRKEFELSRLEREVISTRQLYDLFMQRSRETKIGELQSPVARVIDYAKPPKGPVGPNKRLIVGLSALVALLAAVSLALLLERLDNKIKASHEVESKLSVKAIGVLQHTTPKDDVPLDRLFLADSKSVFAEGIRTIRSDVMLAGVDSPHKILVVTSSVPEEGKTTIACNLAFALAQLKKTLLLEADMRRPKLARALGVGHPAGLSDHVAGDTPLEQCIFRVPDTTLDVLHAGRVPPNPLELLSSRRFTELLLELKKTYDVVIIDSPPVQLVSDALVLAQFATAVLFVVKADDTPYPLARQSIRRLQRANAPVLGAVLNQLDVEKADKYYGEFSGYGGRYYKKYGYYSDKT